MYEKKELSAYIQPEIQNRLESGLKQLQNVCLQISEDKGFHEKDDEVIQVLRLAGYEDLAKHVELNIVGNKLALVHSELSEALEGVRTGNSPSDKLHEWGITQEEEELADAVIRIFNHAGKRGYNLGRTIIKKLIYNCGRERLHGKKF